MVLHTWNGHLERLAASSVAAGVCVCLFFFLRFTGAVTPVASLILLFTASMNIWLFFFDAASPSDVWWSVMTPPMCAFLFGFRRGTVLTILFVAVVGAVATWSAAQPGAPFSPEFPTRFVGVLVVVSVMSLGFERGRQRTQQSLEQARSEALEARDRLQDALAHSERLTRAAKAASDAKTAFLAKVSHELRTPLNGVLGMTEILLASELDEEQRERAETIEASARVLLGLVGDLLDVSRVEAGKLTVEEANLDLFALVDLVASIVGPSAREKGLELEANVDDDAPRWIRGDAKHLQQVLSNLASNAVKFTTEGKVSISVRAAGGSDEAVTLIFEVADTGIGMSEEVRRRVFDPFYQADQSPTRRQDGIGLGLSIVSYLVTEMGGNLTVESEPDVGTTFTVTASFSLAATEGEPKHEEADAEAAPQQSLMVLVVEDNRVNQRVAEGLLHKLSHSVNLASNGREALEMLSEGSFDVVLMDLSMPEMDGLTATSRIRGGDAGPTAAPIPIIAMTASGTAEDRNRCLAAGMDGFVMKPVTLRSLRAALGRHAADSGALRDRSEDGVGPQVERGSERSSGNA